MVTPSLNQAILVWAGYQLHLVWGSSAMRWSLRIRSSAVLGAAVLWLSSTGLGLAEPPELAPGNGMVVIDDDIPANELTMNSIHELADLNTSTASRILIASDQDDLSELVNPASAQVALTTAFVQVEQPTEAESVDVFDGLSQPPPSPAFDPFWITHSIAAGGELRERLLWLRFAARVLGSSQWGVCGIFLDPRPANVDLIYSLEMTGPDSDSDFAYRAGRAIGLRYVVRLRPGFAYAMCDVSSIVATYSYFESDTWDRIDASGSNVLQFQVSHPSVSLTNCFDQHSSVC